MLLARTGLLVSLQKTARVDSALQVAAPSQAVMMVLRGGMRAILTVEEGALLVQPAPDATKRATVRVDAA